MAATAANTISGLSPFLLQEKPPVTGNFEFKRFFPERRQLVRPIGNRSTVSEKRRFEQKHVAAGVSERCDEAEAEERRLRLKDYFEQSRDMIRSDGGPPRWFSPLECASRADKSPLLLYLPGIDGIGLGLSLHHQRLGGIFDLWSLHIPVADQTPFKDLVKLVERTVRSENRRSPKMPIYLVGESVGASLALCVAARNPDIDLILILANPATSFSESDLQPLIPLLEFVHEHLHLTLPYILSSVTGIPLKMTMNTFNKRLPLQQAIGEISETAGALLSYISVLGVLPGDTLLWKLQLLRSASAYANSHLHAVTSQTLILFSERDWFSQSQEEGERLRQVLPKCEVRRFSKSSHALFLEDGIDLVTIMKVSSLYRRAKCLDYVSDYIPPSPSEFRKISESLRLFEMATAPVMLSTSEDGRIVKGLAGIPSEGPVLYVGYHMLLGLELGSLVVRFMAERNIILRGLAHPVVFQKLTDEKLPEQSFFDDCKLMGAVPVSASNFYRLLSLKSHVLLYPGGAREALHRKGEDYKLFWPEQSEFVRMAMRFGATIVPFGVVGVDDISQLLLDYDDLMKIPSLKAEIANATEDVVKLRVNVDGEVGNQDLHPPVIAPKIPGRFYYLFGKPIQTRGKNQELRNREKAHELYLQVKSEVEKCIRFLKEKREQDPYRAILSRLFFHITHGFDTEAPTFEL